MSAPTEPENSVKSRAGSTACAFLAVGLEFLVLGFELGLGVGELFRVLVGGALLCVSLHDGGETGVKLDDRLELANDVADDLLDERERPVRLIHTEVLLGCDRIGGGHDRLLEQARGAER